MSFSGGRFCQIAASVIVRGGVALWVLTLATVLHSPRLYAEADVDAICAGTLESPAAAGGNNQQKLQYCQAAKSAQEAASADSALYKVWGAVGVVCTYACTASFADKPVSEHACAGSTLGGAATQGVVTKDFSGALTQIATAGGGYAVNQAANAQAAKEAAAKDGAAEGKDAAADKPKKKDYAACMSAATAVGTSVSKHRSMKSNENSANSNLQSAAAVEAAATAGTVAAFKPGATGAGGETDSNGNGGGSGAFAQGNGGSASNSAGSCASRSSGVSVIQCAVQSDRNLPGFVTSPKFAQEFQKKTGQSLNNFLTSPDSGSATRPLAEAMAGAVPIGQGAKLAAALETLNQGIDSESMGGNYVGGGGALGGGGGSGDDMAAQMGSMMQGLMDQMNPEKAKEVAKTGVFAVDFAYRANQSRGLAAVADDKKLSIFDRVTYRYYFVGGRIVQGDKR